MAVGGRGCFSGKVDFSPVYGQMGVILQEKVRNIRRITASL
jgi:hypothetical protein